MLGQAGRQAGSPPLPPLGSSTRVGKVLRPNFSAANSRSVSACSRGRRRRSEQCRAKLRRRPRRRQAPPGAATGRCGLPQQAIAQVHVASSPAAARPPHPVPALPQLVRPMLHPALPPTWNLATLTWPPASDSASSAYCGSSACGAVHRAREARDSLRGCIGEGCMAAWVLPKAGRPKAASRRTRHKPSHPLPHPSCPAAAPPSRAHAAGAHTAGAPAAGCAPWQQAALPGSSRQQTQGQPHAPGAAHVGAAWAPHLAVLAPGGIEGDERVALAWPLQQRRQLRPVQGRHRTAGGPQVVRLAALLAARRGAHVAAVQPALLLRGAGGREEGREGEPVRGEAAGAEGWRAAGWPCGLCGVAARHAWQGEWGQQQPRQQAAVAAPRRQQAAAPPAQLTAAASSHHQRPSRSAWLGSTGRVQGSQPMEM